MKRRVAAIDRPSTDERRHAGSRIHRGVPRESVAMNDACGSGMRWIAALGLVHLTEVRCGVAAHPLSARGVRVESPVPTDGSNAAFVLCRRGREAMPAGTIVARYRGCALVVSHGAEPELHREEESKLRAAKDLRKVDAGLLLKAWVRWHTLHLVVTHDDRA
jgi:hypothetical protein